MQAIQEKGNLPDSQQNSPQKLTQRMKQYLDYQPAYLPSYTQLCRMSIKVL